MSLNRVQAIGNVGKDPEIKSLNSGSRVANFSLAVSEKWKDKQTGEAKEKTEWLNVVVWTDALIGVIERYVKKGSKLYVEGKYQTRKYQDASGNDRYSTEVVIQGFGGSIQLLGDAKGSSEGGGGSYESQSSGSYGAPSKPSEAFMSDDLDDQIPFVSRDYIW